MNIENIATSTTSTTPTEIYTVVKEPKHASRISPSA